MKNYAVNYATTNDSIALEQRWYVKEETARGTLLGPAGADFVFALEGGTITYTQPFMSSPHRSGRHHTNIIKQKKECSFTMPSYFNIDETLGAASSAEIDPAMRVLFKSLLGRETTSPNLKYDAMSEPDTTFSLFEVGDKWSYQTRGAFVQGGNMKFPGDGQAMTEWSGNGVEAFLVGIGKSVVDNDAGNTVTVAVGEGYRFPVGSLVMLVSSDGVTRSADTPDGTYRSVVSVAGDVVTLSGAVLADADGSTTPVYLVYGEPATPTAINNPVTGLIGSAQVAGLSLDIFRNVEINIQNNHELVKYAFGKDALAGRLFVPGSRLTAELSIELNLTDKLVEFYNKLQAFQSQNFTLTLGSPAGRRFQVDIPKFFAQPPSFSVPASGSVPVTFKGNGYQTAFDAADEISVQFK